MKGSQPWLFFIDPSKHRARDHRRVATPNAPSPLTFNAILHLSHASSLSFGAGGNSWPGGALYTLT